MNKSEIDKLIDAVGSKLTLAAMFALIAHYDAAAGIAWISLAFAVLAIVVHPIKAIWRRRREKAAVRDQARALVRNDALVERAVHEVSDAVRGRGETYAEAKTRLATAKAGLAEAELHARNDNGDAS